MQFSAVFLQNYVAGFVAGKKRGVSCFACCCSVQNIKFWVKNFFLLSFPRNAQVRSFRYGGRRAGITGVNAYIQFDYSYLKQVRLIFRLKSHL